MRERGDAGFRDSLACLAGIGIQRLPISSRKCGKNDHYGIDLGEYLCRLGVDFLGPNLTR